MLEWLNPAPGRQERKRQTLTRWRDIVVSLFVAVIGLIGCDRGDGTVNTDSKLPRRIVDRGVFLSSDECAALDKLMVDQCSDAIIDVLRVEATRFSRGGRCSCPGLIADRGLRRAQA